MIELEEHYLNEDEKPILLMTAEDVARILGIGRSTVHQLVKEGRLGCVQITTRNRRFTKEVVEEFIRLETVHRDCTQGLQLGYVG